MSVNHRNVIVGRHPLSEKLEAVRQRMYGELSYQEVLERYHVSSSTFSSWLQKYRSEVFRCESSKGIPLYVLQPEDQMSMNEHEEPVRLRRGG